jgi:hypothetical protein
MTTGACVQPSTVGVNHLTMPSWGAHGPAFARLAPSHNSTTETTTRAKRKMVCARRDGRHRSEQRRPREVLLNAAVAWPGERDYRQATLRPLPAMPRAIRFVVVIDDIKR